MQIRWYQQSSHGRKCAISEKNRLPPVAIGCDDEREPELVAPDRRAQELERPAHADQPRARRSSRSATAST